MCDRLINDGTFLACSTFSAKCKFIAQVDDRQIRDFKVKLIICNIFVCQMGPIYSVKCRWSHLTRQSRRYDGCPVIVVKGNNDSEDRLRELLEQTRYAGLLFERRQPKPFTGVGD